MECPQNSTTTFFGSCSQFPSVINDELIDTRQFLDASRGIVQFVEFLGTVFSPVKSDINGNITKLAAIYEKSPTDYEHLHNIIKSELELPEGEFHIGTDALLWLTRAIEYIKVFLTLFVQDFDNNQNQKSLEQYFGFAYEATLKKYHGWFVQKIFGLCLKAAPGRDSLLKLLSRSAIEEDNSITKAIDSQEELLIFNALKSYLVNLEKNIDTIHKIYTANNIDYRK